MKKEDINERDVLINPKMGFCGYVVKIEKYITLRALDGKEMTFDAEYLEPAPAAEVAKFQGKTAEIHEKHKISTPRKGKTPEEINAGLERFVAEMAAEHPASAEQFRGFWREVMGIIGEHQEGKRWDMRWRSKDHFCPVLKAPSHRSTEWVSCIYLLFGENVRVEMRKSYIPVEFDSMFTEIRNAMHGSTHGFKMDWGTFNAKKRVEFLRLLKTLYSKWQGN